MFKWQNFDLEQDKKIRLNRESSPLEKRIDEISIIDGETGCNNLEGYDLSCVIMEN